MNLEMHNVKIEYPEGCNIIIGVIDGFPPKGVETDADRQERRALLRRIGYKP